MKKLFGILLVVILILVLLSFDEFYIIQREDNTTGLKENIIPSIEIEKLMIESDQDGDGLLDLDDLIEGARAEVERQPNYHSAYYAGGYPPDNEGVCTDLVWRAFRDAGYNVKDLVDKDIKANLSDYPRVQGKAEPNIDFRRVPNLLVFFKKYAANLTTEIKPGDVENLAEWQGGDIVIYGSPLWHIAIVSDKRRSDGVPYILHNAGPTPREEDYILDWTSPIVGHFRFPKY